MATQRNTFSSSWHRVADLRPRLRAGVRITRQRYRGRVWYLFHDPSSTSHYRMSRPAYAFAGLLDGRRTIQDAWTIAAEALADEAPTQDEAITVLGQMHTANILHADLPGDAHLLLRRQTLTRRREARGYFYNILFARFRIADPDALLATLRPILGPLFSVPALIAWTALVLLAVILAAVHWPRLLAESGVLMSPSNLAFLYAASVVGKVFHETAHGVAAKQMARAEGAPASSSGVHAIGVMLLILVPFPYIDASSAWTLRSRWRRAVVGAAGIFSDLALASIALIIWSRTAPGSALHRFALNLAVINSVSSILFNANPLMRFDGYYILTDLIGQPNLYHRSRETLLRLCRRVLFGVHEPQALAVSSAETALFTAYGLAAAAYRVLITLGIVVLLATQWFALAIPLAALAVIAFFIIPVLKLIAYLANSPQLNQHRPRAVVSTSAIALTLALLIGVLPVPDRVRAAGTVEPAEASEVYALAPGFIVFIADPATTIDHPETPLVTLANPQLHAEIASLEARLRAATLSRRAATGEDPAAAIAYAEQESALQSQLNDARARAQSLHITAASTGSPTGGVWLPGSAELRTGAYISRAQPLGRVIDPSRLRVRVPISNAAAGIVADSRVETELRVAGAAHRTHRAERSDPTQTGDPATPFEVYIDLPPDTTFRAGQTVHARFTASSKPIAAQLLRAARQTLQRAAGAARPDPAEEGSTR